MVKDLKGWELINDRQKVVVKSFRGAKISQMHWHAKSNMKKIQENIIIHCGSNDVSKDADPEEIAADIINLSKSVSEESESNVIISGLVPRKGYLNAKGYNRLRDYCRDCMLTFFKHGNINAKNHWNISGLHLRVSLFNENFVNLLNTLNLENWHKDQNSEGNKTVNTDVSEDWVATDNEIDGFTKLGLLRKMHIKHLLFGHLNINSLREKREFLNLW